MTHSPASTAEYRRLPSVDALLQRAEMGIGNPKAARLMEQLEAKGVVGPDMGGGRGREVLLKKEEDGEEDGEELFE